VFLAATKDWPCIVFIFVWLTKVIVAVITVDTIMLLIRSGIIITSKNLEFILPERHQR
jgi:hypothetical protein